MAVYAFAKDLVRDSPGDSLDELENTVMKKFGISKQRARQAVGKAKSQANRPLEDQ